MAISKRTYNVPIDLKDSESQGYLFHALYTVQEAYMGAIIDDVYNSEGVTKKGCHPFMPETNIRSQLSTFRAIHEIFIKERYRYGIEPTFCDAGCGIGNIMLIAMKAYFKVYGVENDRRLAKWAKLVTEYYSRTGLIGGVEIGDLLEDPHRWKKFDVVYYYCPMSDPNLQSKFERILEDNLKVGAFIVACLKKDNRIRNDPRFEQCLLRFNGKEPYPFGTIYRKIR